MVVVFSCFHISLTLYFSAYSLSVVEELRAALSKLESRVSVLEKRPAVPAPLVNGTAPNVSNYTVQGVLHTSFCFFSGSVTLLCCFPQKTNPPTEKTPPPPAKSDEEENDDIDLFGSDEEVDEEAERLKEQRLQEYAAKKAKKPALIAKSSILLDVKPVSNIMGFY